MLLIVKETKLCMLQSIKIVLNILENKGRKNKLNMLSMY